jgi:hypothetical protein
VEDKRERVAHFHKHTIESFLEIVGAMGLKNPSELSPDQLVRRVAPNVSKPLNEIYEYLQPGQLLGHNIPESFSKYWMQASADRF